MHQVTIREQKPHFQKKKSFKKEEESRESRVVVICFTRNRVDVIRARIDELMLIIFEK